MSSDKDAPTRPPDNDEAPIEFEQTILQIKEVFVYKVPPLRSASGHRAEEWGLANPVFTGFLIIKQGDTKLRISIYSYKNPQSLATSEDNLVLFGECPIEVPPKGDITYFVDAVIDSSRYYVIRLKDPKSTRTTLIGIGFRDREVAFDFKNALNEYVRYVDRMERARLGLLGGHSGGEGDGGKQGVGGDGDATSGQATTPVPIGRDLSLKEGEKITIKAPGILKTKKASNTTDDGSASSTEGTAKRLAPPPPPGSVVGFFRVPPKADTMTTTTATTTTTTVGNTDNKDNNVNNVNNDDDDFGDFESA